MRLALLQISIAWEDKTENIKRIVRRLDALKGTCDLAVLPEMCTTGFSMNTPLLGETNDGATISRLHEVVCQTGIALAGSFIGCDDGKDGNGGACYNRAFLLMPDGRREFRDKRHLFRMGEESKHYCAGNDRSAIEYRGWRIRLMVCYDLRFPVWSRNDGLDYDLAIYVANWPTVRQSVWDALLVARALENQAYVCGVNRVGEDGMSLTYSGGSRLVSFTGKSLVRCTDNRNSVRLVELDQTALQRFREKFPAWKDADSYQITSFQEGE